MIPWWPLGHSRVPGDEVLAHGLRKRIGGVVDRNPGASIQEISRSLGANRGTVIYHLKVLERSGLIRSRTEGRSRRFYAAESKYRESGVLALARKHEMTRVARHVLENPGINQIQLVRSTGVSVRTAQRHLARLVKAGLVRAHRVGRGVVYYATGALRRLL